MTTQGLAREISELQALVRLLAFVLIEQTRERDYIGSPALERTTIGPGTIALLEIVDALTKQVGSGELLTEIRNFILPQSSPHTDPSDLLSPAELKIVR